MKSVRGKALLIIRDMVRTTDTKKAILEKHGVREPQFYNRWMKDAVFLAKYQEEQEAFESELRTLQFGSKKRRLEERERLYDTLPDSYPYKLLSARITVDADGNQIDPDSPDVTWTRLSDIIVRKSNVPTKSAILDAIERELEGVRLVADTPGAEGDVSRIIEKRREQAAALERFRREEREKERQERAANE